MTAPAMSAEQAVSMVEETLYYEVLDLIDLYSVFNLEERVGRQLAARGVRGEELLSAARALIAKAFRRIAADAEGGWQEDDALRRLYLQAIEYEEDGAS